MPATILPQTKAKRNNRPITGRTVIYKGRTFYRTKALAPSRAAAFLRCVLRNPAFCDALIIRCPNAHDKSCVLYAPVRADRRDALRQFQEDLRDKRAEFVSVNYHWFQDEGMAERGWWYCCNLDGEVYEVSLTGCDCPDHTYRSGPAGMPCKHMIALRKRQ